MSNETNDTSVISVNDLVKVERCDEMKSKNLSNRYGHVFNIIDDLALVEFNDFVDWVPLKHLKIQVKRPSP